MKLNQADIDRLTAASVPSVTHLKNISAEDYIQANAAARDTFLDTLTSFHSQSTAKDGEILPPPPNARTQSPLIRSDQEQEELTPEAQLQQDLTRLRPRALQGLNLTSSAITCRADLTAALSQNLPTNELQLPRIIYRADLLDWRLFVVPDVWSSPGVDIPDKDRNLDGGLCADDSVRDPASSSEVDLEDA